MEVEEIQAQACKFPRIGNGRLSDSSKIGHKGGEAQYPDDDDDGAGDLRRLGSGNIADAGENRLRGWHHSSRIIRVSRASGGKDRHSKVWTSKGLRDRRVRLSVTTAIQFYDLQDRLGYDQPSKAVEWLIKAAADAISELPSLNSSFPDTPKQLSDEKREGFDSAEMELDHNFHQNHNQNNQNQLSASKSSSTSETSKGSGLSLSRSEVRVNRVKASRERAKERAAKEKEQQNVNPVPQNSSFTELLTGGNSASSPTGSAQHNHSSGEASLYHKAASRAQWGPTSAAPMDYFSSSGLLGGSSSSRPIQGFHLGNSYNVAGDGHHPEQLQQFSFVPDHFIPVVSSPGGGGDYNLNFTISSSSSSSGLAGYNRGTLQSNSPSFMLPHHLQRFASPIDGSSNVPFFIGTATPVDHQHHHHQHLQQQQHQNQFPAGLQLCYGDGSSNSRHHSDHKEKGKNS